jgi:hypothetical protein
LVSKTKICFISEIRFLFKYAELYFRKKDFVEIMNNAISTNFFFKYNTGDLKSSWGYIDSFKIVL